MKKAALVETFVIHKEGKLDNRQIRCMYELKNIEACDNGAH